MAQDPERTLAAIRAIGYTDVELLWSFNLFGRHAAAGRGDAEERGSARAIVPHVGRHDLRGMEAQSRTPRSCWSTSSGSGTTR